MAMPNASNEPEPAMPCRPGEEEACADAFMGRRIQPLWTEEEARKLPTANYIRGPRLAPFARRDGRLVAGR